MVFGSVKSWHFGYQMLTLISQNSVRRTLVEVGNTVEFGPPKSSSSLRTLVLPAPLSGELSAHVARYRLVRDELLFTDRGGRPLRRSRFRSEVLLPAAKAARLSGLTFHGLRHSAATRWVSDGIDVRTVQAWLGHTDPQLVLRLYAHVTDTASRESSKIVSATYWPSAIDPS